MGDVFLERILRQHGHDPGSYGVVPKGKPFGRSAQQENKRASSSTSSNPQQRLLFYNNQAEAQAGAGHGYDTTDNDVAVPEEVGRERESKCQRPGFDVMKTKPREVQLHSENEEQTPGPGGSPTACTNYARHLNDLQNESARPAPGTSSSNTDNAEEATELLSGKHNKDKDEFHQEEKNAACEGDQPQGPEDVPTSSSTSDNIRIPDLTLPLPSSSITTCLKHAAAEGDNSCTSTTSGGRGGRSGTFRPSTLFRKVAGEKVNEFELSGVYSTPRTEDSVAGRVVGARRFSSSSSGTRGKSRRPNDVNKKISCSEADYENKKCRQDGNDKPIQASEGNLDLAPARPRGVTASSVSSSPVSATVSASASASLALSALAYSHSTGEGKHQSVSGSASGSLILGGGSCSSGSSSSASARASASASSSQTGGRSSRRSSVERGTYGRNTIFSSPDRNQKIASKRPSSKKSRKSKKALLDSPIGPRTRTTRGRAVSDGALDCVLDDEEFICLLDEMRAEEPTAIEPFFDNFEEVFVDNVGDDEAGTGQETGEIAPRANIVGGKSLSSKNSSSRENATEDPGTGPVPASSCKGRGPRQLLPDKDGQQIYARRSLENIRRRFARLLQKHRSRLSAARQADDLDSNTPRSGALSPFGSTSNAALWRRLREENRVLQKSLEEARGTVTRVEKELHAAARERDTLKRHLAQLEDGQRQRNATSAASNIADADNSRSSSAPSGCYTTTVLSSPASAVRSRASTATSASISRNLFPPPTAPSGCYTTPVLYPPADDVTVNPGLDEEVFAALRNELKRASEERDLLAAKLRKKHEKYSEAIQLLYDRTGRVCDAFRDQLQEDLRASSSSGCLTGDLENENFSFSTEEQRQQQMILHDSLSVQMSATHYNTQAGPGPGIPTVPSLVLEEKQSATTSAVPVIPPLPIPGGGGVSLSSRLSAYRSSWDDETSKQEISEEVPTPKQLIESALAQAREDIRRSRGGAGDCNEDLGQHLGVGPNVDQRSHGREDEVRRVEEVGTSGNVDQLLHTFGATTKSGPPAPGERSRLHTSATTRQHSTDAAPGGRCVDDGRMTLSASTSSNSLKSKGSGSNSSKSGRVHNNDHSAGPQNRTIMKEPCTGVRSSRPLTGGDGSTPSVSSRAASTSASTYGVRSRSVVTSSSSASRTSAAASVAGLKARRRFFTDEVAVLGHEQDHEYYVLDPHHDHEDGVGGTGTATRVPKTTTAEGTLSWMKVVNDIDGADTSREEGDTFVDPTLLKTTTGRSGEREGGSCTASGAASEINKQKQAPGGDNGQHTASRSSDVYQRMAAFNRSLGRMAINLTKSPLTPEIDSDGDNIYYMSARRVTE
ncbi:unnamed protein product [Amoebophrya sp. A25]|nr:unnamed protein product [Amoebophrya sp. A25]|eukprot:GSA25T00002756001.1